MVSNRRFAIVPSFVPTPDHVLRGVCRGGRGLRAGMAVARAFDGFLDRLHLRVDVAARRGEVAVAGEVAQVYGSMCAAHRVRQVWRKV